MYSYLKGNNHKNPDFSFFLILVLVVLSAGTARAQQVEAAVDTAEIQIGEQVNYQIKVEIAEDDFVAFPEGQSFSPLEVVESFPVDTVRVEDRLRLLKQYAITQFDSGAYTIPRQRVLINDRSFFTDSLEIKVNTVEVDTTKQKLFPIKPAVEVPPAFVIPQWIWWLIGVFAVVFLGYFLYRLRKKRKEKEEKLPPYEQALSELKRLDDEQLLEKREIKEYYSQLSAAVRRYFDQEIYDRAMESTTGELIRHLEKERERGRINIDDSVILRLRKILERSDLTKFANSRPDLFTAKEDRTQVEEVIKETKASIPEPSEEELAEQEDNRFRMKKKKRARKLVIGILVVVLLLSGSIGYLISSRNMGYFSEALFGDQTKEMLEGDWIRSAYGTPPVAITTPDVLVRQLGDSLPGRESFTFGSLQGPLFIGLNTKPAVQDFRLEQALEDVYSYLEAKGASNILTKQEQITTINGAEGLRIFGTMNLGEEQQDQMKKYSILNFSEAGGFQQIIVIYDQNDEYAEEIEQRIISSVELVNAGA